MYSRNFSRSELSKNKFEVRHHFICKLSSQMTCGCEIMASLIGQSSGQLIFAKIYNRIHTIQKLATMNTCNKKNDGKLNSNFEVFHVNGTKYDVELVQKSWEYDSTIGTDLL